MAGWLKSMSDTVKSARDLALMRPACVIAQTVLDEVCDFIRPGLTTRAVDQYAAARIQHHGAHAARQVRLQNQPERQAFKCRKGVQQGQVERGSIARGEKRKEGSQAANNRDDQRAWPEVGGDERTSSGEE